MSKLHIDDLVPFSVVDLEGEDDIVVIDRSDISMSPFGTFKKLGKWSEVREEIIAATLQVLVNNGSIVWRAK